MTAGRLVARNLLAHPVRSSLLVLFAVLTLFLFAFLTSILSTLSEAVRTSSSRRVTVQSGVGPFAELPGAYLPDIAAIPGVESVSRMAWFGGYFREPGDAFASIATDIAVVKVQYPEVVVSAEETAALLADRRGCLLGARLAARLGVRVGDPLPLIGTIYPLPGRRPWDLTVRAVYRSSDPLMPESVLCLHWDLLEEVRRAEPTLAVTAGYVTLFVATVEPDHDVATVCRDVDARFQGGPIVTHTQTEAAHRASEIAMLGELPTYLSLVGGVALVAMLLAVANAMGMIAGERAHDVGILKALGFSDGAAARLLLLESSVLVGGGGLLGVALAKAAVPAARALLAEGPGGYDVLPSTIALGTAISIAIGVVGAIPPAIRVWRVSPLDVLRQEA